MNLYKQMQITSRSLGGWAWRILRRIIPIASGEYAHGGDEEAVDTNWSDEEITTEAKDTFSFRDYAHVLANRACTADTPITMGILGRWGSGKTSAQSLFN